MLMTFIAPRTCFTIFTILFRCLHLRLLLYNAVSNDAGLSESQLTQRGQFQKIQKALFLFKEKVQLKAIISE
jgi:hypothetical protein